MTYTELLQDDTSVMTTVLATANMATDRGLAPTEIVRQTCAAATLYAASHGLDLVVVREAVDDIERGAKKVANQRARGT